MADNNNSNDEYRCHSCPNKTFKDFYLLLNHFEDQSNQQINFFHINYYSYFIVLFNRS